MKGNVTVAVVSESVFAGQRDELHFTGKGTLEKTGYGYCLQYTAKNDADGSEMTSQVKLERQHHRAVIVNETGDTGYGLLLDPKAVTATKIESGQGALTLNVTTQAVRWDLGGKQGSIELEYTLLMGASPMSGLRLHMDLKEEKTK